MARGRALRDLAACLRGRAPARCDWVAVVNLANQCLVTPQLAAALDSSRVRPPDDLWAFLLQVRERNRERNRRLWAQLNDATAALNAAGIEPLLLKGAAILASSPAPAGCDRLLSDLDLQVEPEQVETAISALRAAGFPLARRNLDPAAHVAAELGRPQDVGYIDLHRRAPGPPGIAGEADVVRSRRAVRLPGGRAAAPTTAAQLLHLVLHDQFHDGGYWRGGFDLRHLMDTARLARTMEPAEWGWLRQACQTDLVRAALNAQLLSARRLTGAAVPQAASAWPARLTCLRWNLQYRYPALRAPLAGAALMLNCRRLAAHRRIDRAGRARVLPDEPVRRARWTERLQRLTQIMRVESGKA